MDPFLLSTGMGWVKSQGRLGSLALSRSQSRTTLLAHLFMVPSTESVEKILSRLENLVENSSL